MASISSLTGSSSTSSIYGNRNVISGLASGMDTEAMIENSISGYKSKITSLQKQQVKTEWKQDAYRSIISKMVSLTQKYTSYTSTTNLFSNTFFNRAVITQANGKYASKVSATGKSSSDIAITSIKSVATAARYAHGIDDLVSKASSTEKIDWDAPVKESTVAGSISMVYGSNNLTLRFGEDDIFENQQEFVDAINKQLDEQTIKSSGGASKASEFLEARVQDGRIILEQKEGKDNKFYISSASEELEKRMGGAIGEENAGRVVMFTYGNNDFTENVDILDHLQDRTMSFTLNGSTKTIQLGDTADRDEDGKLKEGAEADEAYDKFAAIVNDSSKSDAEKTQAYADLIQSRVNEQFGAGKINVTADDGALDIKAATKLGSDGKDTLNYTLTVNSSAGRALGMSSNGIGNTLNTSWTLEDVLGKEAFEQTDEDGNVNYNGKQKLVINGKELGEFGRDTTIESIITSINNNADAGVSVSFSKLTNEFVFTTRETGSDQKIEMGEGLAQSLFGTIETYGGTTGKQESFWELYDIPDYAETDAVPDKLTGGKYFNFEFDGYILGISMSTVKNATVQDMADELNKSIYNDGWTASVNEYTGLLEITDEDGNAVDFTMGYNDADLGKVEFKAPERTPSYTAGTDSVFTAKINGSEKTMTRSTNVVDLDGLSVTLKGTFSKTDEDYEPITFTSTTDSDTIVDAIKSFVEDYNAMVKEIHDAYSTLPYQKSSGSFADYEPLVGDETDGYSESELARYEEKAKQGILFGDSDLRSLYQSLTGYIQGSGVDGATLRAIGIGTTYEDGLTTINLDETKLREALSADPDKVRDAFTKTTENGASTNGLMQNLKTVMDRYASTSIATPGILVQMAGTPLSSYSLTSNQLQNQMDSLETQIEKWQDKMSDRIDYYTSQFTRLEQLINQMNSQSSALAGLMGG